jgi:hypothetical protein
MSDPAIVPRLSTDNNYDGAAFKPLYTAQVTVSGGSSGHGRATGKAQSADGVPCRAGTGTGKRSSSQNWGLVIPTPPNDAVGSDDSFVRADSRSHPDLVPQLRSCIELICTSMHTMSSRSNSIWRTERTYSRSASGNGSLASGPLRPRSHSPRQEVGTVESLSLIYE